MDMIEAQKANQRVRCVANKTRPEAIKKGETPASEMSEPTAAAVGFVGLAVAGWLVWSLRALMLTGLGGLLQQRHDRIDLGLLGRDQDHIEGPRLVLVRH